MLVHAHRKGFSTSKSENKTTNYTTNIEKKVTISKKINKKSHRRAKRNSIKSKKQKLCVLGVNADGIKGKWSTFKNVVNKIKPLIWNIQETKFLKDGGLKMNGYKVFEHIRSTQDGGGGLAIGCSTKLKPVLTKHGGDDVEAITINVNVKNFKISFNNAYGPQNNDSVDKKDKFWQYFDEEAKRAENEGDGFLLQGDLNAWLGSDIIPNDPRDQNNNGKRFNNFLKSNNLTVVNALKLCKGLITRKRIREGKMIESIVDFVVVCKRLLPFVTKMIIDDKKQNSITNYQGVRYGRKSVDSDHMVTTINMNLNIFPQKPQKIEIFDFKNENGQAIFKNRTTNTMEFSDCFKNISPLLEHCDRWLTILVTHCSKSFPVIRIRNKSNKTSAADKLIEQRNQLKKKIEDGESEKEDKLNQLEKEISDIIAEEENNKAKLFKKYCNESNSINVAEMWKLKKMIWPKKQETLPTGKLNNQGKMITDSEELKHLYAKEFLERLRKRPSHPNFENIHMLKNEIFKLKMKKAKENKSKDWSIEELDAVLKEIKKGKSRDPEGLSREIFHINNIGENLKISLLIMFNQLKHQGIIPSFMKRAIISPIPKKGSQFKFKNERGIFIVNSVRGLLMRLIYNSKYHIIDSHMSESNVGSRKNRSCIDHIFVLNSIVHEQLKSVNNKVLQIQICDFQQMFDGMDLEESMSDLYDSGVNDDHLQLIYESNRDIKFKVKTPHGMTVEKNLKENVLQGDTLSSITASNQVDTFGKELLKNEPEFIFRYKDEIPVGILAIWLMIL